MLKKIKLKCIITVCYFLKNEYFYLMQQSNKIINRDQVTSNRIFDNRSLEKDYPTVIPILKKGIRILDVGCGTGAISKGIADLIGDQGRVIGIDNTEKFINSGKESYGETKNLQLMNTDLFNFNTEEKFDVIVSARTLQWLTNPKDAIVKMKSLLKPGGQLSVLDYNHENLEWDPLPPPSMQLYYQSFLRWRSQSGMNNHISEDLVGYFKEAGLGSIESFNSNETYKKGEDDFLEKIGIWSKVALLNQVVEEGYISEKLRRKAIEQYDRWCTTDAQQMIMKLKEVRGRNNDEG